MKEKWNDLIAEDRPFSERAGLAAAAAGLLAFTLFVFAPIDLYFSNIDEFWFRLEQFWWLMALLCAAVFAGLTLVGLALRGRLMNLYVTLLFALALAFYLQGNFLNIDYGQLTGERVEWERFGAYALKNFALFGLIVLVPFAVLYFSKRVWKNMVRFVSLGLVAVQVVALVSGGILTRRPRTDELALGWAGVDSYSAEENLVLIVVDALDQEYLAEYLAAEPEGLSAFEGFVQYDNTAGISLPTLYAMVPILTGRVFDYDPPALRNYLDEAWGGATMFQKLQEADFDVRVLGQHEIYIGNTRDELFDNYVPNERGIISYPQFAKLMMELVFYTYLPHVFKAGFWMYPGEFNYLQDKVFYTEDDTEAYRHMAEAPVNASSQKKTFRMYHLNALHEPFTLDANAERTELGSNSLEQTRGTMKIVNLLLSQMKEAGVYDASTIVITADHGSGTHQKYVPLTENIYNPVLFVKPAGGSGALTHTSAPASVLDIRATLLDAAGLPVDESEGVPLWDLTEGQARERPYFHPIGDPKTFHEYAVSGGDANDFSNWTDTGRTYAPPDNWDPYA